jgi:hypothetical protein
LHVDVILLGMQSRGKYSIFYLVIFLQGVARRSSLSREYDIVTVMTMFCDSEDKRSRL